MNNGLFDQFIEGEVRGMSLKDKLTGFLVKKKKRGTFQALEESGKMEDQIVVNVVNYIHGWLLNEFISGELKEKLSKEIRDAVYMELARTGYDDILKNK